MILSGTTVQCLLFTLKGEKPTYPVSEDLKPGDAGFKKTDLIPGVWAYNSADKIWYYNDGEKITVLNPPSETLTLENVTLYDSARPNDENGYAYYAGNTYVTFSNPDSENSDFHEELIYRCIANALKGENPETNTEKWANQGDKVEVGGGTLANIFFSGTNVIKAITDYKDGNNVVDNSTGTIYKYDQSATEGLQPNDKENTGRWVKIGSITPDWTEIYIDSQATGNNDGSDWDNAYTDLMTALNSVGNYTRVYVANRMYAPLGNPVSIEDKHHIEIIGVKRDRTEIDETPVVMFHGYSASGNAIPFYLKGTYCLIDNFSFIQYNSKTDSVNKCILSIKGTNNIIQNINVASCSLYNGAIQIQGGYNTINNIRLQGIEADWCSGIVIWYGYNNIVKNIYADSITCDTKHTTSIISDNAGYKNEYDNIYIENFGSENYWSYPLSVFYSSNGIIFNRVTLKDSKIRGLVIVGSSKDGADACFLNCLIENCSSAKTGTFTGIFSTIAGSPSDGIIRIANCTTRNNTELYSLEGASSSSQPCRIEAYHCIFTEETLKHPSYSENISLVSSFTSDISEAGSNDNITGDDPGFISDDSIRLTSESVNAEKIEFANEGLLPLIEYRPDLYNFLMRGKYRYRGASQDIVVTAPSNTSETIEKTFSEVQALISSSSLKVGSAYHVTDLDVYFEAITSSTFAKRGIRRMLVPSNYTETTDSYSNVWKSVWYPDITVDPDDLVIYFGQVFKSLLGVAGTGDESTKLLDETNWELIDRSSFRNHEYTFQYYECEVDFTIGAIIMQRDKYDNEVYIPKFIEAIFGYSVLDYCDWGWYMGQDISMLSSAPGSAYLNNKFVYTGRLFPPVTFFGFANNRNCIVCNNVTTWIYSNYTDRIGYIRGNNVLTGIDHNKYSYGIIIENNYAGEISNNTGNSGDFRINSNQMHTNQYGEISNNTARVITSNKCSWIIDNVITIEIGNNNIPSGIRNNNVNSIVYCKNNGGIWSNTGVDYNISHCINNGDISGLTLTADVTDTIVNKE